MNLSSQEYFLSVPQLKSLLTSKIAVRDNYWGKAEEFEYNIPSSDADVNFIG